MSLVAVDFCDRIAQVVGHWVGGSQDLPSGLDLHGAVAPGGANEFLDTPTSLGLDPMADGQRGDDDAQVRVDGFAFVV